MTIAQREQVSWPDWLRVNTRRRCAILDQDAKRCGRRARWSVAVWSEPQHHPFMKKPWMVVYVCDECAREYWPHEFSLPAPIGRGK